MYNHLDETPVVVTDLLDSTRAQNVNSFRDEMSRKQIYKNIILTAINYL